MYSPIILVLACAIFLMPVVFYILMNNKNFKGEFVKIVPIVKIRRLVSDALMPTFAYAGDACFDLKAIEDVIIEPSCTKIVKTGIAIQLPISYEATLRTRSSFGVKNDVRIHCGTIDQDYTGEITVKVYNLGKSAFEIKKGQGVAQVAVRPVPEIQLLEVDEFVQRGERGDKGFGSSDKK